jgi:hypothetical protein
MATIEALATKIDALTTGMQEANDKRLESFTALLSSIEMTLAEMLENIESGGGAAAIQAMASAMRDLKISTPDVTVTPQITVQPATVQIQTMPAPMVQVNVDPTPIEMHATIPAAPAPIIHLIEREPTEARWEITIPSTYGPPKVMTIVRKA